MLFHDGSRMSLRGLSFHIDYCQAFASAFPLRLGPDSKMKSGSIHDVYGAQLKLVERQWMPSVNSRQVGQNWVEIFDHQPIDPNHHVEIGNNVIGTSINWQSIKSQLSSAVLFPQLLIAKSRLCTPMVTTEHAATSPLVRLQQGA